eukprot:5031-Heterococcus_DN1.PRE.3
MLSGSGTANSFAACCCVAAVVAAVVAVVEAVRKLRSADCASPLCALAVHKQHALQQPNGVRENAGAWRKSYQSIS